MNRQKLQEYAFVAEMVAGASIVITLAFLAFEMRSNTDAIRAQTYHELISQINEWRAFIVTDQSLSALAEKRKTEGWQGLSGEEERRMWYREIALWGVYESAFFAMDRGILGDEEWMRFETAVCRRYERPEYWDPPGDRNVALILTPKFVDHITQVCGE